MADTSYVSESAAALAAFARLRTDEDPRMRAYRRTAAGAAVGVLHVLFAVLLIYAEWSPSSAVKQKEPAPLLWLVIPQPAQAPKVNPTALKKEAPRGAPTTYVVPIIKPPPENNAIDLGLALGQALACGANSFEYLTPEGRARCRRQPWHFVYDRYGNIILDAAPRVAQQEKPRQSDIQARERNTADPCAIAKMSGTECIDKVIFGDHPP